MPDNKTVARWDYEDQRMHLDPDGDYMRFTDHERVVGELTKDRDEWKQLADSHVEVICEIRDALTASHAEIERLKKGSIRWFQRAGEYLRRARAAEAALQRVNDIVKATQRSTNEAYETACQNGDGRMQSICNARTSLLNNIRAAMENNND